MSINADLNHERNGSQYTSNEHSALLHQDDLTYMSEDDLADLHEEERTGGPVTLPRGTSIYHRQKYYTRLFEPEKKDFVVPQHVIPSGVFFPFNALYTDQETAEDVDSESGKGKEAEEGVNGSVTVVFGMWNTMMGSGLLAVPWGFQQSGLVLGFAITIAVCIICCYTCWLVWKHSEGFADFSDTCNHFLGKHAGTACWAASVMVLFGAFLAYDSLMSDSLYIIIKGIRVFSGASASAPDPMWSSEKLAPVYLILIIFPIASLRDISPVVKFNSVGIMCVCYIMIFITVTCILHGFSSEYPVVVPPPTPTIVPAPSPSPLSVSNFEWWMVEDDPTNSTNTSAPSPSPSPSPSVDLEPVPVQYFSRYFYYLGGMAIMMFFIHNSVLSIGRTAKDKTKIKRNIIIAFSLVCSSYCLIGSLGYLSYRYLEDCFPQNFLMESVYPVTDIYAMVARAALLLQLSSVMALISFIVRVQLFGYIMNKQYPGMGYIIALNCFLIFTATCVSAFFPNAVGTTIRFSGAICGFFYVFCLPVLVNLRAQRQKNQAKPFDYISAGLIISFATFLLSTQFIPSSSEPCLL